MQLKDKLIKEYQRKAQNGLSFKEIRNEHILFFEKNGFPNIKNEDWKYTNLLPVLKTDYSINTEQATITNQELNDYILTNTDTYRMVFINGHLSHEHSIINHDKVIMKSMDDAKIDHAELVQKHWNKLSQKTSDGTLAINTALAENGAFVYVPKNTVLDKPIQIVFATKATEAVFSQTRSLVIAEENAQIQITERHQTFNDKEVFCIGATEIFANNNAIVDFYKIQNNNSNASLVDHTLVGQQKRSNCTVDTLSIGGKFTRNNLNFYLNGEHAESNMQGITLIGKDQLVDHHTLVDHAVPNCLSNELYKGIFDNNSKGVFNGKVMVRPDAQKTNAFQSNNNLLLTNEASIDTKPQLEIYADDVACSHGCTIGQLDDEALFYLRSRGIPFKEAQAILMYAFSNDVLENIKIDELKEKINRIIAEKLGVELSLEY